MKKAFLPALLLLINLLSAAQDAMIAGISPTWSGYFGTSPETDQASGRAARYFPGFRLPESNPVRTVPSAGSLKWRLDSIVGDKWDESLQKAWSTSSKSEYQYNSNGSIAVATYYQWDENAMNWEQALLEEFTYDNHSRLVQYLYSRWEDSLGGWTPETKEEYLYYTGGQLKQFTSYSRDLHANEWVGDSKRIFTIDDNGLMVHQDHYLWIAEKNSWILDYEEDNIYDIDGLITQCTYHYKDMDTGEWEWLMREQYTYSGNTRLSLILADYWDVGQEKWFPAYKETYSYDNDWNMILYAGFIFDYQEENWISYDKQESVFDEFGNLELAAYSQWIENGWMKIWKEEYAYDNTIQSTEVLWPFWMEGGGELFRHMLTEVDRFKPEFPLWAPDEHFNLYYTYADIQGLPVIAEEDFRIYPNPAGNRDAIRLTSLACSGDLTANLLDLSGRRAGSWKGRLSMDGSMTLSLPDVEPGTYFIRITDRQKIVFVSRIVIQ